MKAFRFLRCSAALAALVLACVAGSAFAQQTLQQVFDQAERDYKAGRIVEAQQGYNKVLKHSPNYIRAKIGLANCVAALRQPALPQDPLTQLSTLIVPSVELDNASLGIVLEYVSQKAEELSGGKIMPNIVYRGTPEEKEQLLVSMKLRNTPLSEVLRYAGQATGTRFMSDKFAIICLPPSANATTPAAPAAAQQSANGSTPATATPPAAPATTPPSSFNNPSARF